MSDRTSKTNNHDFEIMPRGAVIPTERGISADERAYASYDAKTSAELRAEADEGTGIYADDANWRALQEHLSARETAPGDCFNWWAFGALVILALAGLYLAVVFLWGMV